jgi:RNA polymerase sigma factor (sigma-70 family)
MHQRGSGFRGDGVRSDDPVAIVRELWTPLIQTARAVVASGGAAEDLVQEALLQTLRRYPAFAGLSSPLAYSRAVLLRLAWKERSAFKTGTAFPAGLDRTEASRDEDPLATLQLWEALRGISRKQRACLYLRHVQDMSDESIAAVLGCRASTVRSQLARGAKHLRRNLETVNGEENVRQT